MERQIILCWGSIESSSTSFFFFFNDTATTEIYTLSLHDALPISGGFLCRGRSRRGRDGSRSGRSRRQKTVQRDRDRKSPRLNSSHSQISYAVFCLKNKNQCSSYYMVRCICDCSTTPRIPEVTRPL